MYGGSLTLISAIDSFQRVKPTMTVRVVTIGITALLSLVGALSATDNFLSNFNNFLLLILYLFIPWTAVNLVDYYVVRKGHYAIAEIFKPDGMYGRWGWRGIAAYLIGFAVDDPVLLGRDPLHRADRQASSDGADISFFIGLPVAAILYWVFSRSIDVDAETRRGGPRGAGAGGGGCAARAAVTDAWATAQAIADGSLTSTEAVGRRWPRSRRGDGEINAFTVVRPDAALRVAAEVDAGRRTGPLAGRADLGQGPRLAGRLAGHERSAGPCRTTCPTRTASASSGWSQPARSWSARPTTRSSATAVRPSTRSTASPATRGT